MKNVQFMRAIGIYKIHLEACRKYNLAPGCLGIPEEVFHNLMTLIPLSEVSHWFANLETHTQNPDIVLDVLRNNEVMGAGSIRHWLLSGLDFTSTMRRMNSGFNNLQSGAFLTASISGSIVKWTYQNPYINPDVKVHDSVRLAVTLVKVMRLYLGESYSPLRVRLSGVRKNVEKYREFFGCDIDWSHTSTEVWFHSEVRLSAKHQANVSNGRLAMSFSDLDELLNMPAPEDLTKVIYEAISYSRFYGLPTLEHVSSLLGLSTQQLQRIIRKQGMTFSTASGYVLSNISISMMTKRVTVDEIARRLGYTNVASFNRMFKKNRGLTPIQYIQHYGLNER